MIIEAKSSAEISSSGGGKGVVGYRSHFDDIRNSQRIEAGPRQMVFSGPVSQLFKELEDGLADAGTYDSSVCLALHPPRIIRAAIDWKITHPRKKFEQIVQSSIDAGLVVYERRSDADRVVGELKERIATEEPALLSSVIQQKLDYVTWSATNPELSRRTAQELSWKTDGGDVIFIALGHGGTAAGMDTFLMYKTATGNKNSNFYVVRYSRNKEKDLQPRLSEDECAKLDKLAKGKKVVLFDEDRTTGRTMNHTKKYLHSQVLTDAGDVITISNNVSDKYFIGETG